MFKRSFLELFERKRPRIFRIRLHKIFSADQNIIFSHRNNPVAFIFTSMYQQFLPCIHHIQIIFLVGPELS